MLHQKPSLARWQQTSVIAKTPALFIDVGERAMHYIQIPIKDKLSSLQRELLSLICSGRNSIMFVVLATRLRLLENKALLLYAIPSSWCPCTSLLSAKQNPLRAGRCNVNKVQLVCWVCVWCIISQQPTVWVLYKAQREAHGVPRTGGWEHLCTPGGDPWAL